MSRVSSCVSLDVFRKAEVGGCGECKSGARQFRLAGPRKSNCLEHLLANDCTWLALGTGEQEDVRVPMSSRRTSEPQHGGRCKEWLRGLPRPIYWSAKPESGAIVLAKSRHKISDLAPHDYFVPASSAPITFTRLYLVARVYETTISYTTKRLLKMSPFSILTQR
jgi:hypothetical protein